LVASLLIILPSLNAINRTLGIEVYGFGFLEVRGFVEALYLKNYWAKASFISKPMMTDLEVVISIFYLQTLYNTVEHFDG